MGVSGCASCSCEFESHRQNSQPSSCNRETLTIVRVLLYIVFFSATTDEAEDLSSSTASLTNASPVKRRDPLVVGSLTFTSLLVIGIVSAILVYGFPDHTQGWANFLGVVAGVLAAIQYIPQIYTTWKLKDAQSLSIVTMVIQVPGAIVFAISLWLRVGWQGWSTWTVYLVTAALQSCVLALAITYNLQKRRLEHENIVVGSGYASNEDHRRENGVVEPVSPSDGGAEEAISDERTALLPKRQSKR